MKNRLLTMAACALVAAVGSPSFAGNWEKPSPKGEAPVSKSQYYIYNVAAGQFIVNGVNMTGAAGWGTRVTLGDKGLLTELTDSVHTPLSDAAYNTVPLQGWTVLFKDKFDGQYDKDLQDVYMFVDTPTQMYTNMAAQGHNFFKFIPWGDNYKIKIADEDDTYGLNSEYANTVVSYMSGVTEDGVSDPIVYPLADVSSVAKDEDMAWRFVSVDGYTTFVAKKALYNKLNQAEEEGASTAEAETVYNNDNATASEYEAATVALQRKIFEVYAADASYDNPIDLTEQAIQTPLPGSDGTSGWTYTNNGNYFKTNKHSDWSNEEDEIDVYGPNFVEYWRYSQDSANPVFLTNDTLYQVIGSLPYGMYRLTADAVAIQQAIPGQEITGVSLFADGGAMTKTALWSQVNHVPHRYSIEFAVMQDETTIGMMIENTNANHAAITNFKLEFLGASDNPLVTLLQVEVSKAEALDPYDTPFSVATEEQLKKVVEEAKALIAGDATDEELNAKTAELTALLVTIQHEIDKYNWASEYLSGTLAETIARYEVDFPGLGETLDELSSSVDDALYERTISVAEIDALEAKVDQLIKEGILAEITVGKEITGLLVNPDFTGNSNGWTLNSGAIKNTSFNACEAYGQVFDLSQTLTGMPNGRYKVTCQAFYRPRASAQAWADYLEQNADAAVRFSLYGNMLSKAVKHVFDDQQPTQLYTDDVQPAGEGGMWSPNSINGITAYFAKGLYENELEFAVVDGTLTIGLRNEDPRVDTGNDWCAFDNFHLYYLGEAASDYAATIEALMEEAMALQQSGNVNDCTVLTSEADNKIVDALLEANQALQESATVEQCVAAINALNEAIEYGKESQRLTKELGTTYLSWYSRMEDVVNPTDNDFYEFLDGIDDVFNGDGVFASNEEVQNYLDELAPRFTAFAISGGIGKATEDNPHDITAVIVNPGFTWDNADSSYGWSGTTPSVSVGVAEFYSTQTFDIYQTIQGMIPGFYRVSVDAFYRAGSTENSTKMYNKANYEGVENAYTGSEENFPYLYAGTRRVALMNQEAYTSSEMMDADDVNIAKWLSPENADKEAEELPKVYVPNTRTGCNMYFPTGGYKNTLNFEVTEDMTEVTFGIKKGNVKIDAEWLPFDNFKLEYLGAEAPTGIQETLAGGGESAAEVVSQKFYTLDGMELARPAKGINIVKSVLGNGSVKVTKVLVK